MPDLSIPNNSAIAFCVNQIESSLIKEIKGCKIQDAWKAQGDERTCDACDFKTFCKNKKTKPKEFTIP